MAEKRSLNKVILIGNVGRDPEIRTTGTGSELAKFSLVTNEVFLDKNNTWQESAEWHDIVVWGKWQVQKVQKHVTKGTMVMIEGKIKTSKWQDKESNATRSKTEIVSQNVVVLKKSESEAGNTHQDDNSPPDDGPAKSQAPPSYDIDSDVPYDESDPF